jgi:hypothetical protein
MNLCKKHLTFQERELAILRQAIDEADEKQARQLVNSPEIKKIVDILESFLRKKKLICYGGTAINNILPKNDRFYDFDKEIPDYDFFSKDALSDAKELADIYYKEGFKEVQAKAGVHHGTYKVFVNFTGIADITNLESKLYNNLLKDAIVINEIYYAPPNYLRMSMYLELSRPYGEISRWEKVLKRSILLNKNYPISAKGCDPSVFQREFENNEINNSQLKDKQYKVFGILKNLLIDEEVVFFGGYASYLYGQYMPKEYRTLLSKTPDFDVLSINAEETAQKIKAKLLQFGFDNVKIIKHTSIGEVIPLHYEVRIGLETVAFIYEPLACHNYNEITINNKKVRVATIDTMLSFYLAFIYADRPYYDIKRILCMAAFLFDVQRRNRLSQKGILKRFSLNCYGEQQTLENIRAEKTKKFEELKNKKNTKEYESWFLNYSPSELAQQKSQKRKEKEREKRRKLRLLEQEKSKTRRNFSQTSIKNKTLKAGRRRKTMKKYY